MFIIKVHYKVAVQEVDKYMQAHRDYLDYYFKQGLFLISGPMQPRIGDIILAMTKDKSYLETVLKEDPYLLAEIVEYELIEFTPVGHRSELQDLIYQSEGKLC